jgi:hypothetical protein
LACRQSGKTEMLMALAERGLGPAASAEEEQ